MKGGAATAASQGSENFSAEKYRRPSPLLGTNTIFRQMVYLIMAILIILSGLLGLFIIWGIVSLVAKKLYNNKKFGLIGKVIIALVVILIYYLSAYLYPLILNLLIN